jgi:hypothetical protein
MPKSSDDVCADRDGVVIATTSERAMQVVGVGVTVGDSECHKDMGAGGTWP